MADKTVETLVEAGTKLRGSVESECKVVVRGQIEGDVQSPALFVSEGGKVAGTIIADEIESRGTLSGEIEAGRVLLSGSVLDDSVIRSKFLEIKAGATPVAFGTCELEVGEAPSKEARLAAARERMAAAEKPAEAAEEVPAVAAEAEAEGAEETAAETDAEPEATTEATEAAADGVEGGKSKGKGKKKRARTDSNWGDVPLASDSDSKRTRPPTDAPPTA